MYNFIAYKQGKLLFSTSVSRPNGMLMNSTLEDWLTPRGLVIPLSTASYEMAEMMRRPGYKPKITDLIFTAAPGMLLSPDGTLFEYEYESPDPSDRGRPQPPPALTRVLHPITGNHVWARCRNMVMEERALTAVMVTDTLEEALAALAKCTIFHHRIFQVYDVNELLDLVRDRCKIPEQALNGPSGPNAGEGRYRPGPHQSDETLETPIQQ